MQKFYKGRTNNHLTWVMVDSTDFATPESALSAAMKIKVYGKLRSATGVNFVSSGTGSLTNDIQHVGASVLGIYTIALAKADLSDASAAWYDQYIVSLSATGAAYQTLVIDGGIDDSNTSNMLSYLSNVVSYLSNMESNLSIVVSDIRSNVSDLQSDFQSRVPKAVATNSQLSDLASDLRSVLILHTSTLSDIDSALTSQYSDVISKIGAITVTLDASAISDIASAVVAALPITSVVSDIYSLLSDFNSNFNSRVPKEPAARSQLSDLASDLRSYLVVMSGVQSDIYSLLSDHHSDFQSRVIGTAATASQLSDRIWSDYESKTGASPSQLYSVLLLAASRVSDVQSYLAVMSGVQSDLYSLLSDHHSDFQSRVPKAVATNSQLSDLASDLKSYLVGLSAIASDAHSAALLAASSASDVYSAITTARAEPGVSAPAASKDVLGKMDYVYKFMRNRTQADSASVVVYNDDTTTVGQKATQSDDGTTYTRGEFGSG